MRTTRTQAEGLELVQRWQASGMKARDYAAREGMNYFALQYWIRRQRELQQENRQSMVELVPVPKTGTPATGRLTIVFPSGMRVELPESYLLEQVLAAVARS